MIEPQMITRHDLRYLRDEEISLSLKMQLVSQRHLRQDYQKFVQEHLDETNISESIESLTSEYASFLSHSFKPIKYKTFWYATGQVLVTFSLTDGRALFAVHISW